MDIFLAVLPALFWGTIVVFNVKLGGGPYSQILGTTIGALLLSIVIFIFSRPEMSPYIFLIGLISGLFWTLGQTYQLKTIQLIGVAKAFPISTGLQLISTSLFGVIVFREWDTIKSIVLGVIAVLLIIAGVVLTSIENKKNEETDNGGDFKKGMVFLIISTIGYLVYVVIIRLADVGGWQALMPQGVGMVIGALILTLKYKPYNLYTIKNIIPGLVWAAGNLFLFISQPRVGVATSYSLSQMGVVIATLGGIFILKEKKTKLQLICIAIGIVLIVVAGFLLGIAKA